MQEELIARKLVDGLIRLCQSEAIYAEGGRDLTISSLPWIRPIDVYSFRSNFKIAHSDNGDGVDNEVLGTQWTE